MNLANPVEFARLTSLWCARTISAAVAEKLGLSELKGRLSVLADNATAAKIKAAADDAAAAARSAAWSADSAARSAAARYAAWASADDAAAAAAWASDAAAWRAADALSAASAARYAAADAANAANAAADAANAANADASLAQFKNLVGQAILDAWVGAGGEVDQLRRPGINQLLVSSAKQHGLDMSAWHCGTAHCIAGWYSTLGCAPQIEAEYSCWLAAVLTFAANNPGEPLPYMGSDQALGKKELKRIQKLGV